MIHSTINRIVQFSDSVLDIGCGDKSKTNGLSCKRIVSLDAWPNVNPDILLDLEKEDLPFGENEFEVILMIDFIEHLEKNRGKQILEQAKKFAQETSYF